MTLTRNQSLSIVAVFAFSLIAVTAGYFARPKIDRQRVYKIGFGGDRPLHFADQNGKPVGLAVGMVREAARRRGIQLQWVQSATPGIKAITRHDADFWILLADLPERRKSVHFTEPYIVTEYCFLVPENSPYKRAGEFDYLRIAFPGFGAQRVLLSSLVPHAALLVKPTALDAVQSVMKGDADAAFTDQYSAGDMALSGGLIKRIKIIPAPSSRRYLGMGSSFAVQHVADEIRAEMRVMAADGTMEPLVEGWGFFPNLNLEAMDSLYKARRREQALLLGVAILVVLLGFAYLLVQRLSRQRSQLVKIEAALRDSEDRFRSLANGSLEGIMIHAVGAIVDTNAAFARLFGYSHPEELIGANPLDLLDPEFRERIRERIEKRETGVIEVVGVRRDGSKIPFETESRNLKYRGRQARLVAWRDISERQRAMAALQESEERYKALFERSLDCVFLVDLQGKFLDANRAALDLLGFTREEIQTVSFESLLSQEEIPHAAQGFHEVLMQGFEQRRREYQVRRKDGSFRFMETQSSLIYRGGKPYAVQGIARDITDRKRADEETAKLQAQLHQANKMESIGRLAGGVAHDFNNLLTVILGYADMAISRFASQNPMNESQIQAGLEQISRAATKAASLTNQLLLFSRRNPSAPENIRLNDVVLRMEDMLQPLLGDKVHIMVSTDPAAGQIYADPGLIEQVIVNLAMNSRDAMPDGGKLFIETSLTPIMKTPVVDDLPPGSLSAPSGRYVSLTVSDTGTGMTPAVQARLFEPFFTTKEPGQGTGLGLATVYGIVKQSGGHISLQSVPGLGTSFRILFPAVPIPVIVPTLQNSGTSPERFA